MRCAFCHFEAPNLEESAACPNCKEKASFSRLKRDLPSLAKTVADADAAIAAGKQAANDRDRRIANEVREEFRLARYANRRCR
jgi:hypothetical protein